MKTFIVFLLTLAVWSIPLKTASALTEHNIQDQPFINYAQFHTKPIHEQPRKSPQSVQPAYSGRHYDKTEVQDLIRYYAEIYKIDPETPLCIARLESGYNQFSANRSSSARGVFQYLSGTWSATDEGKSGLSVFDADSNVKAAVKYMAIHKNTRPWVVAPNCPTLTFL